MVIFHQVVKSYITSKTDYLLKAFAFISFVASCC